MDTNSKGVVKLTNLNIAKFYDVNKSTLSIWKNSGDVSERRKYKAFYDNFKAHYGLNRVV